MKWIFLALGIGVAAGCSHPIRPAVVARSHERPACAYPGPAMDQRSTRNSYARVAAFRDATCAIATTGELLCWGLVGDSTAGVLNLRRHGVFAPRLSVLYGGDHLFGRLVDRASAVELSRSVICWRESSQAASSCLAYGFGDPRPVEGAVGGQTAFGWDTCERDPLRGELRCELDGADESDTSDYVAAARSQQAMCAVDILGRLSCGSVNELHVFPSQIGDDTGIGGVTSLFSTSWAIAWKDRFSALHVLGPDRRPIRLGIFERVASSRLELCAVSAGRIRCWDRLDRSGVPLERVRPYPDDVVELVAGTQHHCALRRAGELICWGDGSWGKLGPNSPFGEPSAWRTMTFASPVLDVRISNEHSCALLADGSVWCWGLGGAGQTGAFDGVSDHALLVSEHVRSSHVARRVALPGRADAIALGYSYSCARVSGQSLCWGAFSAEVRPSSAFSRLPGDWAGIVRMFASSSSEVDPRSSETRAASIASAYRAMEQRDPSRTILGRVDGGGHSCRWDSNCRVQCWGSNAFGQLGGTVGGPAQRDNQLIVLN